MKRELTFVAPYFIFEGFWNRKIHKTLAYSYRLGMRGIVWDAWYLGPEYVLYRMEIQDSKGQTYLLTDVYQKRSRDFLFLFTVLQPWTTDEVDDRITHILNKLYNWNLYDDPQADNVARWKAQFNR